MSAFDSTPLTTPFELVKKLLFYSKKLYQTEKEYSDVISSIEECFKEFFKHNLKHNFNIKIFLDMEIQWKATNTFDFILEHNDLMHITLHLYNQKNNTSFIQNLFIKQKDFMSRIYSYRGPCNQTWFNSLPNLCELEVYQKLSDSKEINFHELMKQCPKLEKIHIHEQFKIKIERFSALLTQLSECKRTLECLTLNLDNMDNESLEKITNYCILQQNNFIKVNILKVHENSWKTYLEKTKFITNLVKVIKSNFLYINHLDLDILQEISKNNQTDHLCIESRNNLILRLNTFEEFKFSCEILMAYKKVNLFFYIEVTKIPNNWLKENHMWLYFNKHLFDYLLVDKINKQEMFRVFCLGLNEKNSSENILETSELTTSFYKNELFEKHTVPIIFDFL